MDNFSHSADESADSHLEQGVQARTQHLERVIQTLHQEIQQQQQTETELRLTLDRLDSILSSIQDVVWSMSLDRGQTLYVNSVVETIYGYSAAAFRSDPTLWFRVIHPADRASVEAAIATLMTTGCLTAEYRILHADGETRWLQNRAHLVYDEAGQPQRIDGIAIDITQRKQTEDHLRVQSAALEACANGIVITNRQGIIEWVNPAFCELTGYTFAETIGKKPGELVNSGRQGQAFFQQLWRTILAGQVWHGEIINRCKDRHLYIEEMTITPVHYSSGEISHFIAIKQDVTARKQAEAALLEERQVFMGGPTIVFKWRVDLGWSVDYVSQNVYEQLGYPPEQLTDASFRFADLLHPDDLLRVQQEVTQFTHAGVRCFEQEYRLRRADGEYRWMYDFTTVVRNSDQQVTHYLGYVQDITDRKQAEREQEKLVAILESSPDFVAIANADGYLTYMNQAGRRIIGMTAEEAVTSLHFLQTIAPQNLAGVQQVELPKLLHQGFWVGETTLQRRDGQEVPVSQVILAHRASSGEIEFFSAVARDISSLKQAEMVLRQQAERERVLSTLTNRMRRSLNLSQVLETTVTEVRQFLHTDRVLVYRFNPDWSGIVIAESVGQNYRSMLGRTITDACLGREPCITRYLQGHIQNIADLSTAGLTECYRAMLAEFQVKANLVLPILQGEQVWGFLVAQHCSTPRSWHAEEINLLQQLADQVAIAIQQAELYQQVQHLNANLENQVQERTIELQQSLNFEALLKRITDKVRDSLDEQQILQTAVQELSQGLNVECCDTGIYNVEQTTSTIAYEFTRTLTPVAGEVYPIQEFFDSAIYQSLVEGGICQFCDLVPNPRRSDREPFTALACPIVDDQGVLGDLWLFKRCQDSFNQLEVRLVQQVANQCAIALRQSRLYQSAQSQVAELERLNRLKDDFLSTVSHELRSPMANIKMAVQMLEIMFGIREIANQPVTGAMTILRQPDPVRTIQYFQILDKECQREIGLINDLLDLARLDAGTIPLVLTEIALQDWIPHVTESFLERTQQQQQHLEVEIPAALPAIATDLSSLERILTELLHNACKYTPSGGTIKIAAHPASQIPHAPTTEWVKIVISNSGIEIPASEYERIFDRFYRIPNHDPWKHGGTGLGLALVKKLIQYLQGTITVQSHDHQTDLIILLPFQLSDI